MPAAPVTVRLRLLAADSTAPVIGSVEVDSLRLEVEFDDPAEQLTLVSCIGDKVILDGALEMTNRLVTIAVPAE